MKLTVLASIILTAAVAAGPAHAGYNNSLTNNGIKLNGLTTNGLTSNGIEAGGVTTRALDGPKAHPCVTGAEPACEQTSSFSVLSVEPGAEISLRMH